MWTSWIVLLCLWVANGADFRNCTHVPMLTAANIQQYADCTTIQGDVIIGNLTSAQLVLSTHTIDGSLKIIQVGGPLFDNLDGLSSLTTVTGNITISETSLVDVEGLQNIQSDVFDLFILSNFHLNNISSAFSKVKHVRGSLSLVGNYNLIRVDGFVGLVSVGHNLQIGNSPWLVGTLPFGNVVLIGGSLQISYCDSIPNMEGFAHLNTVGGNIELSYLNALTYMSGPPTNVGLGSIRNFRGSITVKNCPNLVQLDELISPNIAYVEHIELAYLPSVRYIHGLFQPDPYLTINQNLVIDHLENLQNADPFLNAFMTIGFMQLTYLPNLQNITFGPNITNVFNLVIMQNRQLHYVVLPSVTNALTIDDNDALYSVRICSGCNVDPKAKVDINRNGNLNCSSVPAEVQRKAVKLCNLQHDDGTMTGGQLFGIVVGCVCGIALVVFVAYKAIGTKSRFAASGRYNIISHPDTESYSSLEVNQDTSAAAERD